MVRLRNWINDKLEKEPTTQEFALEISVEDTITCSIDRR